MADRPNILSLLFVSGGLRASPNEELLGAHGLYCKDFSAFEEVYNSSPRASRYLSYALGLESFDVPDPGSGSTT
ncbi:MAG TPA: hypothetical protein EYP61_02330 [Candidatus Latescibacteria bacterium]|nr:hypothetical protein [Candidatus Latescibacterota bacterium]